MLYFIKWTIILIFAVIPYIFSLDGDFVFDDSEAVVKNPDLDLSKSYKSLFFNDFWGTNIKNSHSHKSYRPLTVLSFRTNRYIDGNRLIPKNFKVTNLLLHALVTLLVYKLFLNIDKRCTILSKISKCEFCCKNNNKIQFTSDYFDDAIWKDEAFLASILFAVHSIHVEAVSGIVGRADVLATLFFLLSFLTYNKVLIELDNIFSNKKYWCFFLISLLWAFLAILSKETGITVVGICMIYDFIMYPDIEIKNKTMLTFKNTALYFIESIFKTKRRFIIRQCFLVLFLILVLLLRWAVMGFENPKFTDIDNPAAFSELWISRVLSYNYIYFINLLLLIWPQWLCFDWSMGCIPIINSFYDYRLIFVIFLWGFFLMIMWKICCADECVTEKRKFIVILSLLVIPFLPASNILLPVGFVVAERILYIPSIGFCAFVVKGLIRLMYYLNLRQKKLVKYLFIILLFAMILKTAKRSQEWMDEKSLYLSALDICPLNAKVHYNIAKNAADQKDISLAEKEYSEAIRLNPKYYQAMNNLANLLKDQSRFNEAEQYLRNALEIREDFPAAWMNLGIVLANLNQRKAAEQAYMNAIKYRKEYADCFYNLGNLYLDEKKYEMALKSWSEATRINSHHVVAWSNMLALLDNTGQIDKALQLIPVALSSVFDAPTIHFNAANLYGKSGEFERAEKHFLKAIELKKNNGSPLYYTNLGVLYHRWKKPHLAIKMYEKALSLDPNYTSAKQNLKSLRNYKT